MFLRELEVQSSVFGDKMHEQVEERLKFYESGEPPRKNVDVMKEAISEAAASQVPAVTPSSEKKKKKKRKKEKDGGEVNETVDGESSEQKSAEETPVSGKKKKKSESSLAGNDSCFMFKHLLIVYVEGHLKICLLLFN